MGVAKLWEENNFLVPWKHGSVIRSDQLVNFSGFTVIFVPVFHSMALFNYYSSKKSKSGVNEKMPMACKSLNGVIVCRFSNRNIWKRKN